MRGLRPPAEDRPAASSPPRAGPRRAFGRVLAAGAVVALAALLAGCAALPAEVPRPPAHALTPASSEQTTLGRLARDARPAGRGAQDSGFRLLPMPRDALQARLALVARAERTIDLQYYLLQNDATGRVLLRALRDAALRGVRVRVLVDDLYTARSEALFSDLSATPGVEVRLFNPFAAGRASLPTRVASSLLELDRINRRMHNKLFVADNAMAVVGGRNIANEYFLNDIASNFIDIDTLAAGPVVQRLSQLFDLFWNSPHVYPLQALRAPEGTPAERQARFEQQAAGATLPPVPPEDASEDLLGYRPLAQDLDAGAQALTMIWAPSEAFSDPPDKVASTRLSSQVLTDAQRDTVLYNVRSRVRAARREVLVTTPYLIPGREGMESIRRVRARGVRFAVVTNSLAATDEPFVHGAYRRYRPELLRLGVELYELSPARAGRSRLFGMYGSSGGRLHGKSAVIDQRTVFIGSFNFDPRSDAHNTELGLFIESEELARQLYSLIGFVQQDGAYRVRSDPESGGLEWVSADLAPDGRPEAIYYNEPEATLWVRWKLLWLAPLVPEDLL